MMTKTGVKNWKMNQKDLMDKWADRNLTKLTKTSYKVCTFKGIGRIYNKEQESS